jgi:hypothetical protein
MDGARRCGEGEVRMNDSHTADGQSRWIAQFCVDSHQRHCFRHFLRGIPQGCTVCKPQLTLQQTDANTVQTRMENIQELVNLSEKIYAELVEDDQALRRDDPQRV